MNIDEKIAECKADIEKCERVCAITAIGSIRDAAMRKAEDCKQMVEWLEELKQLREQNKWIPISKDVPIIGQEVLVCDFDGDMYITSLHLDGGWGFNEIGNKIKNAVAWQELPEPYRAENEGKKIHVEAY